VKTEVGIIGAGPAGLMLARILQQHGIDTVILERRSRAYVLGRIRAGVLEHGTVETLKAYGVGERLKREGIPIKSMQIRWNGEKHDTSIVDESGRHLTTYGQAKVVRDLIEQREADGLPIRFEAAVERLDDLEDAPKIRFVADGAAQTLECQFVAGCDGYHGVSRGYIPDAAAQSHLRDYPFAWFGILAEAAPHPDMRGFAHSTRGLAVASARSESIGRLYLQVPPDFDVNAMSDEDVWDELDRRMDDGSGQRLNRGRITERNRARLRGFVCEAMQHGRLLIAGDAAHIVPPSGAKGLNLAIGDARVMAEALRGRLRANDDRIYADYTAICLRRIWPTVAWSCQMSDTLHMFPDQSSFTTQMQYQNLNHWMHTETGQRRFRTAMLGLPYEI
jgi:p-hydroxybenzoate 3-monooxygenase